MSIEGSIAEIVAFLRARWGEDETRHEDVHLDLCPAAASTPWPCNCGYSARVLREVEANRGMLPHLVIEHHALNHCDRCMVLRLLALPYSDHPGYRQEWKP